MLAHNVRISFIYGSRDTEWEPATLVEYKAGEGVGGLTIAQDLDTAIQRSLICLRAQLKAGV